MNKPIKKKYIIEVEYANDYQFDMHDEPLNIFLKVWSGMLDTDRSWSSSGNKNNKVKLTIK